MEDAFLLPWRYKGKYGRETHFLTKIGLDLQTIGTMHNSFFSNMHHTNWMKSGRKRQLQ